MTPDELLDSPKAEVKLKIFLGQESLFLPEGNDIYQVDILEVTPDLSHQLRRP